MDAKKLVEIRKQAEKAVEEMRDGELKIKAFEVILSHLLGSAQGSTAALPSEKQSRTKKNKEATSIIGRILVLRDEGFFKTPRGIAEVKEELAAHGWHYPLTTLSPRMMSMVQKRDLRRQKLTEGRKKLWKYSNP